jgi:hypothetical protein
MVYDPMPTLNPLLRYIGYTTVVQGSLQEKHNAPCSHCACILHPAHSHTSQQLPDAPGTARTLQRARFSTSHAAVTPHV